MTALQVDFQRMDESILRHHVSEGIADRANYLHAFYFEAWVGDQMYLVKPEDIWNSIKHFTPSNVAIRSYEMQLYYVIGDVWFKVQDLKERSSLRRPTLHTLIELMLYKNIMLCKIYWNLKRSCVGTGKDFPKEMIGAYERDQCAAL